MSQPLGWLKSNRTQILRSVSSLSHLNWMLPFSPLCQYLQPHRMGIKPLFSRIHFSQITELTRLVVQLRNYQCLYKENKTSRAYIKRIKIHPRWIDKKYFISRYSATLTQLNSKHNFYTDEKWENIAVLVEENPQVRATGMLPSSSPSESHAMEESILITDLFVIGEVW